MSLCRPFILRPVATALLMVAVLLTGLLALNFLPLSALPEVDYPTIQVRTFHPGASPEVMATAVTAPLERQLGQIPGLLQMSSTSAAGASIITLQFALTITLDIAEQEVQAAINAASNLLPSDLPAPPIYAKVNPADAPIITLAATSKTLPLTEVQDLIDGRVAQKISQLPGVGLVSLGGGQRPAVRIQADPRILAAYGLNLDDLRTTITTNNVNIPKGSFDGPRRAWSIDANDQLRSAEEYQNIVVTWRNGAPVRLGDVATVIEGAENARLGAWMNTAPAIILNVQRQPGANVIAVADAIKKLLPELRAALPAGVELALLTDRTVTIRAAVHDVSIELAFAVALVVLVIFLFLRNLPATIIPSLSVPLSLVGTLGVMYLAGYSINNLTLMALTIATGFVVDDAIVMIENIARYIEDGDTPMVAALKGADQIAFTIISLTFSLVAVLIPLLFMGDVIGRLFREFAVTLAVTILISAVVSLTLVPMLCAQILRHTPPNQTGAGWFGGLIGLYDRMLGVVLRHGRLTLLVFAGTLGLTAALYLAIPKGFFPVQDTGLIQGVSRADPGVSFAAMAERQQAVARVLLSDPDVVGLSSFIGVDGSNATLNTGRVLIDLKPKAARRQDAAAIARRLQDLAGQVPGITLHLQPVQDLTIDASVGRAQYQFMIQAPDRRQLAEWVPVLEARLTRDPALADVAVSGEETGLALFINVDRDAAARFGITLAGIDNVLYDAFGQRIVSTIFTQANQYRVILEASPAVQGGREGLSALYLPAAGGGQVPLSAIARFEDRQAPLQITRLAQFPAASVSFNPAPGGSLDAAVAAIGRAAAEIGLPAALPIRFQGAAAAFRASLDNTLLLILAAIITMYIVLGVLYESYIHPVTILSTLPSAGIGALLALILAGSDLGIMGVIGIILLIGIVKKNAIMMIDFALDAQRHQGMSAEAAIRQACRLRFRPILMTTMAALLGALPLMLGSGMGSELRQPLGVAIVGGLIVSQLLTLFTTPVIYLAFERLRGGARA